MAGDASKLSLQRALSAVRQHLNMDVAYLSRIDGNDSVFELVDAPGLEELAKPGDRKSLDDVYCKHIVEGRLPELIPDTGDNDFALAMPITKMVPIGSHMSIPLRLPDGEVYGMFCCLSAKPNPSLNERDLNTMRMFADLAAERVAERIKHERQLDAKKQAIEAAIETDRFQLVFQPIVSLSNGSIQGFESLSRFSSEPYRPPNLWFSDAQSVGLGTKLECLAIQRALDQIKLITDSAYVSLNISPDNVMTDTFKSLFAGRRDLSRLMLEITEHSQVRDYQALLRALQPLRERGLKLAVDDAGAGYASLTHIIQLNADVIKLDMSLVRGIDSDNAKRSLAAGMVMFAREMGIKVIAEGIETNAERDTLKGLGIFAGQGFLLGRPNPIEAHLGQISDARIAG
ncbi:MAG: EAL domain-containing protein [Rhizobiales bacterium]|nr:EAL domain-containing protein [Hyphomicrobiales bacterium]MBO6700331.1 EAL domain-containing protein [Hyphomicrobiales bacterium]MBO6737504.1 EAL domain-containing protein [Hyphomicrobiales bacterium]MBO6913439.1 EAL domain-containing protein [Hyphomicrobiales bacterium]MBO6955370.1 EAL domain-containing protein [Hyphomicrobiales bacterium]